MDQENDTADSRPADSGAAAASATQACADNSAAGQASAAGNWAPDAEAGPDASSARPSDADIMEQENNIRREEAQKITFIGEKEPLTSLLKEYEAGSDVFVAKIRHLQSSYGAIRRARGDGNCFFRSFIFALFEHLLQTRDFEERYRLVARLRSYHEKMVTAGYQPIVFEDYMDMLADQLNAINGGADALTLPALEGNMRDDMVSNTMVAFLRMLTSCEIQLRADFFAPFIMGMSDDEMSVQQFRQRCVEPMGEESDHVHIVALTDALQVPIRVLYLDRTLDTAGGDGAAVNHHDFVPDELAAAGKSPTAPRVHLLYRPGHYDILYPLDGGPQESTAAAQAAAAAIRRQSGAAAAVQGGAPGSSGGGGGGPAGGGTLDDAAVSRAIAAAIAVTQGGIARHASPATSGS